MACGFVSLVCDVLVVLYKTKFLRQLKRTSSAAVSSTTAIYLVVEGSVAVTEHLVPGFHRVVLFRSFAASKKIEEACRAGGSP